jgi:hypothetical protein
MEVGLLRSLNLLKWDLRITIFPNEVTFKSLERPQCKLFHNELLLTPKKKGKKISKMLPKSDESLRSQEKNYQNDFYPFKG